MQFKSLLLISVVLSLALTGFAHNRESEEVKVYARGDYAGVIKLLEPKYHATEANIQQRLILACLLAPWACGRRPGRAEIRAQER